MTTGEAKGRTLTSTGPPLGLGLALVFLMVSVAASGPQAAAPDRIQKRIGTPTRQVIFFTDLENQVVAAAANEDRARLDELLATDFQLWSADDPDAPVDPGHWIDRLSAGGPAGVVRSMNVNTLSETAVVSFVLAQPPGAGTATTKDLFLVDIWNKRADTWRLAARYCLATPKQGPPEPSGKR